MDNPNRIRHIRLSRGMTQAQLAAMTHTSQSQIDRLEKGKRRLTLEWIDKIGKALDVPSTDLLPNREPSAQPKDEKPTHRAPHIFKIPLMGTVQSLSSMEFLITDHLVGEIDVPCGIRKIYRGSEKLISEKILSFRVPNQALDPRWRYMEIMYVSTVENMVNKSDRDFYDNGTISHYLIKLISGNCILSRILGVSDGSIEISYYDDSHGELTLKMNLDLVGEIFRIHEWEEVLYGWRHKFQYQFITDSIEEYNADMALTKKP